MSGKKVMYVNSPVGTLAVAQDGAGICEIRFASGGAVDAAEGESELLKMAAKQLEEYFAGERREFDLPLSLEGTEFQKSVWRALCDIPYGETRSYGQIAAAVGNPKASRAVGMANNRNPVSIVVPCHRVIGADGKLVGYGGGLDKKLLLLELEKGAR